MTTTSLLQAEKKTPSTTLRKKPGTSAFSSTSHGPATIPPLKTTKPRFALEKSRRATTLSGITKPGAAKTIRKGSTYRNGTDPFHALIVRHGEPSHWVQSREFLSRHRHPQTLQSNSPPDPHFYATLPESPAGISCGTDVNRKRMEGKEFWVLLEGAWRENLEGEMAGTRGLWEFGGEMRRGVRSCLWEEREGEEEVEVLRRVYEGERLGG